MTRFEKLKAKKCMEIELDINYGYTNGGTERGFNRNCKRKIQGFYQKVTYKPYDTEELDLFDMLDEEEEELQLAELIEKRVGTNLGQIHGTKCGFGKCADVTTTIGTTVLAKAIIEEGYRQCNNTIVVLKTPDISLEELEHIKTKLYNDSAVLLPVVPETIDIEETCKQAVKEFCEKLKSFIIAHTCVSDKDVNTIYHGIDMLYAELYEKDTDNV